VKNIVLYKSKYGNTFHYASWIAEELNWELRDLSNFKKSEIKNYQNIIFGSGVYIGKQNKIKKILSWFKDKSIIIFASAGNNNVEKDINDIKINNFSEAQLNFHKFFYLPGGVDFTKIKGIYKIMLNIFRKMIEKKQNRTADEQAMLDGFINPINYVDKKHIEEIVSYAKKL